MKQENSDIINNHRMFSFEAKKTIFADESKKKQIIINEYLNS